MGVVSVHRSGCQREKRTHPKVSNVKDALEHEQHGPLDGAHGQSVQRLNGQEGLLPSQSGAAPLQRGVMTNLCQPCNMILVQLAHVVARTTQIDRYRTVSS